MEELTGNMIEIGGTVSVKMDNFFNPQTNKIKLHAFTLKGREYTPTVTLDGCRLYRDHVPQDNVRLRGCTDKYGQFLQGVK